MTNLESAMTPDVVIVDEIWGLDVGKVKSALEGAINRLPGSPMEIADFLFANGYRGVKTQSNNCPLANYFQSCAEFDSSNRTIYVNGQDVQVIEDGETAIVTIRLSDAANAFVDMFDDGQFASLEIGDVEDGDE